MTSSTIKLLQENIKRYREAKKFSQAKLSIMAGVSKDHITAIECFKRTPSVKLLVRIANALGVKVKDLFDFE